MKPDRTQPQGHGHETSDVSVRVVVWTAVAFVALGGIAMVMCGILLYGLESSHPSTPPRSLRHDGPAPPLPPEPRLQIAPWEELKTQRAYEENLLHSYGWVDRPTGRARMPIDRAMEIVAERGAP